MTKAEEKLIKGRIKLQSRNPFFSYLSLFIKFRQAKEGELPEQAGMGINPDGLLVYKEEFVEKLNDEEVIGVISHELCHLAFLHLVRRGSREPTAWNVACDLAVNSMLMKNSFDLPKGSLLPLNYEDSFEIQGKNEKVKIEKISEKTAEQIYEEIPELKEGEQYKGDNGETGFDKHNESSDGKPKSKSEKDELENEWKNRLEEAYISSKQRGNIPRGLERYIDGLKKSQVNWKSLLRKYIQATIPNDYCWCVEKFSKIKTPNGTIKIKNLRKGRYVIGYNKNKLVKTKIIDKFSSKVKEEFIITTKSGKKIKCSGEHNILTKEGYVKAKNLLKGDKIKCLK